MVKNMQINSNHELYKLNHAVDWVYLQTEMQRLFGPNNISQCRLMAGLLYLKVMTGMSSDEVVAKWSECPYLRYFCGEQLTESADALPFAPVVLDIWEREMSGKGNNAMIFALLKSSLMKAARKH